MPDSAEHRVEMHRLASGRRARGLPLWDETIGVSDVFHDESKAFIEIRDVVVQRVKASKWYRESEICGELHDIVDELSESEDADEFDDHWSDLYDLADYARVWIDT